MEKTDSFKLKAIVPHLLDLKWPYSIYERTWLKIMNNTLDLTRATQFRDLNLCEYKKVEKHIVILLRVL